MARDPQRMVEAVRHLEQAHSAVLNATNMAFGGYGCLRPQNDDDARALGAIEGLWQAFTEGMVRALGSTGTPASIVAMDEQAREVAQEAYRRAYAEAVAGQTKA